MPPALAVLATASGLGLERLRVPAPLRFALFALGSAANLYAIRHDILGAYGT